MNIVLIGFKNCGKTSVGKLIAEKLNMQFIDTDDLIKQYYYVQEKKLLKLGEIYQAKGEQYFRDLERRVIADLIAQNTVIATGGGSVLDQQNLSYLKKQSTVFYLNTAFSELLKRQQAQAGSVYLAAKPSAENLFELYNQRKAIYQQAADIEIFIKNETIIRTAEKIIFLWEEANGK